MPVVAGDRLLRRKDVLVKVGFKENKLYDMVRAGEFPSPVKLDKTTVWRESDIDRWIAAHFDGNDAEA